MRKKLSWILCTLIILIVALGTTNVKAAGQDTVWNYDKEIVETYGAFTYHAYISSDETKAWIHTIDINTKKEHSFLSIPKILSQKKVTRLGYTEEPYDYTGDDYYLQGTNRTLFGIFIDRSHEQDGSARGTARGVNGIKEISIPDSVEVIQPGAFSGTDYITEITIPEQVTTIGEETFYGCDRLKTINLPTELKELEVTALENCPKLKNLKLSSENKVYKIKKHCVITKKDQALVYVLPSSGKLEIPSGTKILRSYALGNSTASTIHAMYGLYMSEIRYFT